MTNDPTFGSLFAGIGGFDLGLERAGWRCRWQVEIDPFCQRVLAKHWPDVPRYGDVRDFPDAHTERVDLICGGFPCQPVSVAGKRLAQADERWLWPEFARVVRALRPRFVLVENVPGLLVRGVGDVLGDLAQSGYDAEWDCIPASAVGAPHRRDRVWIVAHPASARLEIGSDPDGLRQHAATLGGREAMADPDGRRREIFGLAQPAGLESARGREPHGRGADGQQLDSAVAHADVNGRGARGAPASGYEGRGPFVGDPDWWSVEPDVGRVAHGVPARVDRLRALGNAIVPQVAEWIGRRLMAAIRPEGA